MLPGVVDSLDVPQSFTIKRVSTVEQVAELLRNKILRGEMRPGTPLQEVALANAIGVSRNTMREAIRLLVYEGLIRHNARRGVAVTALSVEDVTDIYRVRHRLELDGVDATRGLPPDRLVRLDVSEELRRALRTADWNATVEWDMTFHRRLVGFLGSARLNQFYRTLLAELRLGLVLVDRREHDADELVSEHEALYELLRAGRQDECREQLRAHLQKSEDNVRRILGVSAGSGTD
jgi:DNA-binding GntR family transcriptional regulator